MLALLGYTRTVLLSLALVFVVLIGVTFALGDERVRRSLRQFSWFRRLERRPPHELRHDGMIAVGFGVCCFAALLTLELFDGVPLWPALTLAVLAVLSVTVGAGLLERAAGLER